MSMQVGTEGDGDEFGVNATINTTPLVDVMLVMLIIFLITIPVVIKTVPLKLPTATNQPTVTKPENIVIAVNRDGHVYWNNVRLENYNVLFKKVVEVAPRVPQPEFHIRADKNTNYEYVGRVMFMIQKGGILKVGFITEPKLGVVAPG